MTALRRAVVLCRPDTASREIQGLATRYALEVVYSVFTDTESPKLAAMIATQHIIEHNAEVLVVPHLTTMVVNDRHWRPVIALAEVIAADGRVHRFSPTRAGFTSPGLSAFPSAPGPPDR